MQRIARLVLLCALLAGAGAQAQILNQLGASPMAQFNRTDTQLFRAAVDKALREGPEGEPVAWSNPKSPASGEVTPRSSQVIDGLQCRELLIANRFRTLRSEGVHTLCRDAAGQWRLRQ